MTEFDQHRDDAHRAGPELSPEDRRLLDALVDGGFDPGRLEALAGDDRRRADALVAMFGLLNDYPVEDADDVLLDATLARIDRAEAERAARLRFDVEQDDAPRFRGRFRVPDFIGIAAAVLILAGVGLPVLQRARHASIDHACANSMRELGLAFASYASDHNGELPTARAGVGESLRSWDQLRNVLNLKPMVDYGYCDAGHLNCPGNHDYSTSYSYQWQLAGERVAWGGAARTIILGDRNPLVDAAAAGRTAPALSISVNHGGRGQNVLANDGAVDWLRTPKVGRDNIWLPDGHDALRQGIRPDTARDVFLTH